MLKDHCVFIKHMDLHTELYMELHIELQMELHNYGVREFEIITT